MNNNDEVVSRAKPHTIKKIELIEKYVESWAPKLLQGDKCSKLVFIDCMSNSGEYLDTKNNKVFGTPVRVARYLHDVAKQYTSKSIDLYFSDLNHKKTEHLQSLMPNNSTNFHVYITTEDGNNLAKRIGQTMSSNKPIHYLLVYDPYEASIDWNAICPFINGWSEVILNHMVSDSIRAAKMAKRDEAKTKYMQTYMIDDIKELMPYGSNKDSYEKRIEEIIKKLYHNQNRKLYISSFPFFNKKNALVYDLVHCTSNIAGFKLYKKSAWKTFGDKSSTKDTHGEELQLWLNYEGCDTPRTYTDEDCYCIRDIAKYLQNEFNGKSNVKLDEVWKHLENHPVFPSDGFRPEIKKILKETHGAKITGDSISFSNER